MSTKTGDEADSIGNIEKFLQQCLEDMGAGPEARGSWQAAYSARDGSVGGAAGLRTERLW